MTLKLKLGLPFLQVVLALGLLVADDVWQRANPGQCVPEASPALNWLGSIDLPVVVPVVLWFPRLPNPWNEITLLAAIGLFWYWVALTLVSWQERRTVCLFSFMPLRLIYVLIPLSGGAVLFAFCCQDLFNRGLRVSWSQLAFLIAPSAWSIVLIFVFGWDLVRCVLRLRAPASQD
jgi:hypothetical protein